MHVVYALWTMPIVRWMAYAYVAYQFVKIMFLVAVGEQIKKEKEICKARTQQTK